MNAEELGKLLKKKIKNHHCCTWGKQCPEDTKNDLHGYCGNELNHGLEAEDIIELIDQLLVPGEEVKDET